MLVTYTVLLHYPKVSSDLDLKSLVSEFKAANIKCIPGVFLSNFLDTSWNKGNLFKNDLEKFTLRKLLGTQHMK